MSNQPQDNKTYVIAAIVGAVAVIIAAVIGLGQPIVEKWADTYLSPTTESTKLAPSVEHAFTPTPALTRTPTLVPSLVLLDEDFEDYKAQGFSPTNAGDGWHFVVDDTGNVVYDTNNANQSSWSHVVLSSLDWQNYEMEYRVRMLELGDNAPQVRLQFRETGLLGEETYYVQSFLTVSQEVILAISVNGSEWETIEIKGFSFAPGVWYSVRVEAQDAQIRVFVDNSLIIDAVDSRLERGRLSLAVGPGTHAQFDNIRVVVIGE